MSMLLEQGMPAPVEAHEDIDPDVEMLDAKAIVKLREYGIRGIGHSKLLDKLDKAGFGNRFNGGAVRRDENGDLLLELYVGAQPFEIASATNWALQGKGQENPYATDAKSRVQTYFSENLGRAPEGQITGMIAEPQPSTTTPASAGGFKPYQIDAWGYRRPGR